MSIPAGVVHVTFGGALPGGEVWESGFWTEGNVPASNTAATELAALWAAQLTATDGSGGIHQILAYMSTTTNFTTVTVYCYPTGGPSATYIGTATVAPVVGTSGTGVPNQVSTVVSLRTDFAGRRNRGRMYLPTTGLSTSLGTGQYASAACLAIATGWGTCFSDWNASHDNGRVVVVSRVGAGAFQPVTAVLVDSVPDTQRRRRNKLVATTKSVVNVTD